MGPTGTRSSSPDPREPQNHKQNPPAVEDPGVITSKLPRQICEAFYSRGPSFSSKQTETETLDKRAALTERRGLCPPSFLHSASLRPQAQPRTPRPPPSPVDRPGFSAASRRPSGDLLPPRRHPGSAGHVRAAMDAFGTAPMVYGRAWPRVDDSSRDLVVKVRFRRPTCLRAAVRSSCVRSGVEGGECRG